MTNQVFFEEDVQVFIQVDTRCPEDALPLLFNCFTLKREKTKHFRTAHTNIQLTLL